MTPDGHVNRRRVGAGDRRGQRRQRLDDLRAGRPRMGGGSVERRGAVAADLEDLAVGQARPGPISSENTFSVRSTGTVSVLVQVCVAGSKYWASLTPYSIVALLL